MEKYGYIRVSTKDQNEERQIASLVDFGVKTKNLYIDKESGKNFNRTQYKKLLKKAKEGDLIVVKSIDRFGRNYADILEQWRVLTKERKIDVLVLDMPLLDTRIKERDLTGIFISDLVLQILSYVSEVERKNIRQRQKEGIELAKLRGVKFGREPKEIPDEFYDVYLEWKQEVISARAAGRKLNVNHSTFLKWAKNEQLREN
ncbi:recombinase family protein [Erysipelothrix anatis]|uniref:recombinase family protein n=1 Tax=Erysipelothrix anatis TaxID=2683713 RepID=UPI0013589373|nr:recombinase family protein [Erysipelothrix anatis]